MSEDDKPKGPQRFADPELDLKRFEPLNPDEQLPLVSIPIPVTVAPPLRYPPAFPMWASLSMAN